MLNDAGGQDSRSVIVRHRIGIELKKGPRCCPFDLKCPMFVLVIAVAALLGFLALLGLLLFARFAESRHIARLPVAPEPLFFGLSYDQAFEDHYELIWQVQVPGLELIRNSGESGVPVHTLRPWFERTLRSYPDLFEGHTFEEWLDFLQRSRVARFSNDRASLTGLGCDLLDHCRMAG